MYSLALTILNSRYVKRLFDSLPEPEYSEGQVHLNELKASVFHVFRISQQEPFALALRNGTSLADFKTVQSWWGTVHRSLSRSSRWFTASLATQAAWAIIAFAFTWVDAFGSSKIGTNVTAFGLAIALCWSWVAVIVLGWFFAGVSFITLPVTEAIRPVDKLHKNTFSRITTFERPIHHRDSSHLALLRPIAGDTEHPGPIYNYARILVWSHMVYHVIDELRQVTSQPRLVITREHERGQGDQGHELQSLSSRRLPRRETAAPQVPQDPIQIHGSHALSTPGIDVEPKEITIRGPEQTEGTSLVTPPPSDTATFQGVHSSIRDDASQQPPIDTERGETTMVAARYLWEDTRTMAEWKRDAYSRMRWAVLCAVLLNLFTVGSAFGLDFATPSVGLGCRSGGVLIYWMASYVVMILLILAARISDAWSVHEAKLRYGQIQKTILRKWLYRFLGYIAVTLRLFGKMTAVLNSAWIIIHCLFEFTRFYDRCYCLTNRGTTYWLWFDDEELRMLGNTERFWVGFASATGITCLIYIAFMGAWTAKRL
ncbi:hypothetical protein FRC17_006949 [Serendipita sp. 399]|nr:hypothetical protein FRC17_006949 [Serendipita sp. 399]